MIMSNKKRILSAALLLIAAAFLLSYAFGREDREKKQLSIIFISKTIDDSDFWTQLIDGARMAAEEYEVKFSVCAPETEDDYVRQNELIEQAILEKPDAIVLTPSSFTETTPMAEKIVENGIRLFLLDSEIDTKGGMYDIHRQHKGRKAAGRIRQENPQAGFPDRGGGPCKEFLHCHGTGAGAAGRTGQ